MSNNKRSDSQARRLEDLWQGNFGDSYMRRNLHTSEHRGPFWNEIFRTFHVTSILEIGCNLGANLQWITSLIPPRNVFGIDINKNALSELHRNQPKINVVWCPARDLPFTDQRFDLVFTMGVLIHQPEESLPLVMSEIVRCAKRYILCAEYYSKNTKEVVYHGLSGALFKRNYVTIYKNLFPELTLVKQGFLSKKYGWDDVTYWVFEIS